jgi:acetyl/propionyl-CoA carboxylase alpha subunit
LRYKYQSQGKVYEIEIERYGAGFRGTVEGRSFEFKILGSQPNEISLIFENRLLRLYWAVGGGKKWIARDGCTYLLEKPNPKPARRPGERALEDIIRAPMPAQVQAVKVEEGEVVEKGQTLLLLEAMKMEIRLAAPRPAQILRLAVQEGQSVERDQILIELGDQAPTDSQQLHHI